MVDDRNGEQYLGAESDPRDPTSTVCHYVADMELLRDDEIFLLSPLSPLPVTIFTGTDGNTLDVGPTPNFGGGAGLCGNGATDMDDLYEPGWLSGRFDPEDVCGGLLWDESRPLMFWQLRAAARPATASLCNLRGSRRDGMSPVPIDRFPTDVSVYGVRGTAGNVTDWTATEWAQGEGDAARVARVVRGGGGSRARSSSRCAYRFSLEPGQTAPYVGFRLAHSL